MCCLGRQIPALFGLLGADVADDDRFADPLGRAAHNDELLAHVMGFMADHTGSELLRLGPEHRIPFGVVRRPAELLGDESFAERGFFDRLADGTVMPGAPFPSLGWRAPTQEPARRRVPPAVPTPASALDGHDSIEAADRPGERAPLAGLRVLDLSMMWAGPFATKLLAEQGADVIKIESPGAWDNLRTLIPQEPEIEDPWNSSYYFNEYNHSKRSLTLDLSHPGGRAILLRLAADADVLVENYRADVLDKLGLDPETLRAANDRLVVISMAGFGKTGALRDHSGFGPIIEMMSGLMSLTGYGDDPDDPVPYKTGISYGDPVGGLHAVAAACLGMLEVHRGRAGTQVDLSQCETAASMLGPAFVAASRRGENPTHWGNRSPSHVPQGCYRCAGIDRWVVISVRHDDDWAAVCDLLGRQDLAHWDEAERRRRHDWIDELIEAWTMRLDQRTVEHTLQARGIPAGAVVDSHDIHDDPQLTHRGFFVRVPSPKMKPYRQSGPTWRRPGLPALPMTRAPWFGEHNGEILGDELGLTKEELADLEAHGVIATRPINPTVG